MLIKIGRTFKDISNFSVLLFLFMFAYSILGMELFANKVKFDDDDKPSLTSPSATSPRSNFDNLLNSMTSIFIILVGDDWQEIMYDHVRATSDVSMIFFIMLVTFGNMILLSLFLAILLKNFESQDQEEDIEEEKMLSKMRRSMSKLAKRYC